MMFCKKISSGIMNWTLSSIWMVRTPVSISCLLGRTPKALADGEACSTDQRVFLRFFPQEPYL